MNYRRRPKPPRRPPARREMRNSTRATKNTIFAMPTAAPAMPPKPSMPAINAMISRVTTRLNIAGSELLLGSADKTPENRKRFRSGVARSRASDLVGVVLGREEERAQYDN